MDWNTRMLHSYPGTVPLPFFMTHPGYLGAEQEKVLLQDLEYLQQMYPVHVRKYQRRVAEILDKMDYEGSMIYDEYPDRYSMERLTDSVWNIIKREEQSQNPEKMQEPETWEWIKALLFVLLNTEVYKRRHGNTRRFLKFLLSFTNKKSTI